MELSGSKSHISNLTFVKALDTCGHSHADMPIIAFFGLVGCEQYLCLVV